MHVVDVEQLEDRVVEEVYIVLTEGDRDYLKGLSRTALFELLETKLKSLGLYALSNQEAPAVITRVLAENIDHWREHLLGKKRGE